MAHVTGSGEATAGQPPLHGTDLRREPERSRAWSSALLADTALNISSFGEDPAGELYVTDLDGALYEIVRRAP